MATTVLGIAGGLIGIIALLLKYYPAWRKRKDEKNDQGIAENFGQYLAGADDTAASTLMSGEFDGVRREKGGGSAER